MSDPYCVKCYKDDLAKAKAAERLARTPCSPSFVTTKQLRICAF
jgi:hypothetical protein